MKNKEKLQKFVYVSALWSMRVGVVIAIAAIAAIAGGSEEFGLALSWAGLVVLFLVSILIGVDLYLQGGLW